LSKKIVSTVSEAMSVENVILFVLDEEKSRYNIFRSTGAGDLGISFGNLRDYPALKWLTEKGEAVIREEIERDRAAPEVVEQMASFGVEVCIPLLAKGKLIGIVALGPKGGGKMYSQEDLDMLTTLANQACIAIENARLYEDLRRTRVHMHRAERLASLGTLTAGLAHEIRNPLVAIKTFTELLPERIDDEEFRDHFLNVTAGEVERISSLVTELLEFSRPSPPNLTETKKKGLVVEKELWDKLPSVLIDREQIKQVLLNVLLNAVDATPEKGSIAVRTRKVARNGQRDLVQIEIRDTGNGISPDKLEHIFTPFYTTKYNGSGLGLAISHQIIQEHEGYIDVESKVDSGTTFYINLPTNSSATALNGEKNEEVAGP
jgi:signal transduction histidine kinase